MEDRTQSEMTPAMLVSETAWSPDSLALMRRMAVAMWWRYSLEHLSLPMMKSIHASDKATKQ